MNQTPAKLMLVYQSGIANLFRVDSFNLRDHGRNAVRIYQGDFRTAEAMASGAGVAGATVRTASCNKAGDVSLNTWFDGSEGTPFCDETRPVYYEAGRNLRNVENSVYAD